MSPICVVCDRCRAEGLAGADPFEAFGALLDFDPVPRRTTRADGWDAEVQRAFIAALSLTGSERAAARTVGKAQYGVTQLLNAPGGEGFAAAREEALAIAADERSRRLAEGLRAIAAEQSGWRPPPAPWSRAAAPFPAPANDAAAAAPADPEETRREGLSLLQDLLAKYRIKIRQERAARLAGRIAEADFYVRQASWIEVAMDIASDDDLTAFEALRVDGHDLIDIARTPFSRLLDEARRRAWADAGEPDRPRTPESLLVDGPRATTEPFPSRRGDDPRTLQQWDADRAAQEAEAARAQAEWEERARAEAKAWAEAEAGRK